MVTGEIVTRDSQEEGAGGKNGINGTTSPCRLLHRGESDVPEIGADLRVGKGCRE